MHRLRQFLTFLSVTIALPALAGEQSITIQGSDRFDSTAVATFVTKFEGEVHTLEITLEDNTVELDVTTENPANGLWQIEGEGRYDGATFRLANASAKDNHASTFTFTQKIESGGGGGGGAEKKTYEAISQQIQIFASLPGSPASEVPRPTTQDDEYVGIMLPHNPENFVRVRLVYHRKPNDQFDASTINLEIANGLKVINRSTGDDNAAAIAAELHPGTEVSFDLIHDSENVSTINAPQIVKLSLSDLSGEIHQDEVKLLPVEVVPDYNRDGKINADDAGKVTADNPWHFWINDNDSGNEEPHFGDIPGTGVDNADMQVNGIRDLVDFFPVHLAIQSLLEIFPSALYEYRISHPTGAFNFIEMPMIQPDSSPAENGAGSYLANPAIAQEAVNRPMSSTANAGDELSLEYLDAAAGGMGILLFEAVHGTNQSFELVVSSRNNNDEVIRIPRALPVHMKDVEKLFWRLDLRGAADGNEPGALQAPEAENFVASRKDRWFVFLHGYNVDGSAARGWHSETFKRLHQMGSDSRFVGVTWQGNKSQIGGQQLTFGRVFAPDYWQNVYNAFATSHWLSQRVNNLPGATKSKMVIAAHSLGNMVVSSAFCDQGLQAGKYFMLNAAVPREAYSPSHIGTDRNNVRHPDWNSHETKLWSSDWHTLFDIGDGRKGLTWQGRFGNLASITSPHNFFSTGEEVLMAGDSSVPGPIDLILGNSAWIKQEMSKGKATKGFISLLSTGNWNANGGWEFNSNPPAITANESLKQNPFFKPFTKLMVNAGGGPEADHSNGVDLAGPNGSDHAAQYVIRAWLLAHDVPAISQPAGSHQVEGIVGTDMNDETKIKTGDWDNWKHSDFKNQEMNHVWKMYAKMITEGDLQK